MLNTKFQASEPSGSEEEVFEYFSNFKHLSQVVLKKKISEYFSMYF